MVSLGERWLVPLSILHMIEERSLARTAPKARTKQRARAHTIGLEMQVTSRSVYFFCKRLRLVSNKRHNPLLANRQRGHKPSGGATLT
jgi:hypothetical protein